MSSDVFELTAEKRDATGKKVKQLRREGLVPATLYEKGKDSLNVSIAYMPMVKAYEAVGQGQPVELTVDSKKYLTMIKDVHMDPVKNTIMHVAFHSVDKNKLVEAEVAVHLEGDAPALKVGNFINRPNDHVLVQAKPSDLPESLSVNVDKLENPGDTVTVADIIAVPHVEILSEANNVLAVVEEPRVEEETNEEVVDAADVPSDHGGDETPAEDGNNS